MQRKIRLSPEQKELLRQHAWMLRTDVSKLIRAKIKAYADGTLPSKLYPRTGGLTVQVTFMVDDNEWDAALERGRREGAEAATVIRHALLDDAMRDLTTAA